MGKTPWIELGATYGEIKTVSYKYKVGKSGKKIKIWNCECEACGAKFQATGQQILLWADAGCPSCRAKIKADAKSAEWAAHIGKRYGNLEIVGVAGIHPVGPSARNKGVIMTCKCTCGSITEIPLSRLKEGGATRCKFCNWKNLEAGVELHRDFDANGSNVAAVLPGRKLNKNNSSGFRGVCLNPKNGKYRAYITFQRKQYGLGEYVNIEDAVSARKAAEEKIHGGFIEWYKAQFPDIWAKFNKNKKVDSDKGT